MNNFNPVLFAAVASQHMLDGMSAAQAINTAAVHHEWNLRLWDKYLSGRDGDYGGERTMSKYLKYFKLIPDQQEQQTNA